MTRERTHQVVAAIACASVLAGARTTSAQTAPASGDEAPEAAEAARRLFHEGVEFAEAERWEDARARFRAALTLHASALLRFNLATAARNAGHFIESVDQYRQFLRDDRDPQNAARRREAQAAIDAIEPVLARVVVSVRGAMAPTALRLDGRPLPLALLGVDAPLDPGDHVFEADGPEGATARLEATLGEGQRRTIVLELLAPVAGVTPLPPRPQPVVASTPRRAPASTIDRVRRAVIERASAADLQGHRRWDHTVTLFALQGTGSPVGIFGAGIRFDARPWLGFEAQVGAGHPFGPGILLGIDPRVPLSYRYALGLSLAFATDFTTIDRGTVAPCASTDATLSFTPAWLLAAITHEWRASTAVAFRLSLGVRWLVNSSELTSRVRAQCIDPRTSLSATDLAFDPPTLDHTVLPVLPWIGFDIGWTP